MKFYIEKEVEELGVVGVYLRLTGVKNQRTTKEFDAFFNESISSVREEIQNQDLIASDAVLIGFRSLHEKVGVSRRKGVASPENLVACLKRTGSIPRINLVVDLYNLVSLKTRLALGAHDCSKISGDVRLVIAKGNEKFVPLGQLEPKPVSRGDYCYIDEDADVLCWLEIRQVEKTKVEEESTDLFYIIQGNANVSPGYLDEAKNFLIEHTLRFCGGKAEILYPRIN